ncbi:FAD-dependent oxidoreductase [bacterium]|nr:FAD-dependent oxidoreductase [bacterium]
MPQIFHDNQKLFPHREHNVDFCVVGGGIAGMCAAIAAARHGAKVLLMHDRHVLGGNASSECRVCINGADRVHEIPNMRETGILEELRLDNCRRNPNLSYSIQDLLFYEAVHFEPNITLLLNCSCMDAEMDGDHIVSVSAYQLTTQTLHHVRARIFADCSGDGILAPLTGAACRTGREGRDEFGESIAPEKADNKTMGMTCLIHSREHDSDQPFTPPSWAYRYHKCQDLPWGPGGHKGPWRAGYWWLEMGGEHDSIHDTERLRDEILKIVLGVWDHIKNCGDHEADRWAIEWIGFLPGKRESRRYEGDHILTQGDIESEGKFDDMVAYGGWTMDDHHSGGFYSIRVGAPATIWHPCPSPYGIAYRTLYSRNIDNLMFSGRVHSASHVAMSSTRVMGTCAVMAQAVGTAAAMAIEKGLAPRDINSRMKDLQQRLIDDDCYLPWIPHEYPPLTWKARLAASHGNPEAVRDGFARPIDGNEHAWTAREGSHIEYLFDKPEDVTEAILALDSGLETYIALRTTRPGSTFVPRMMPRRFRIQILDGNSWQNAAVCDDNHQRHIRVPIRKKTGGVRYILDKTWGAENSRLFNFYLK